MKIFFVIIWLLAFLSISGYAVYLLDQSRNDVSQINLPVPKEEDKQKAAAQVAEALPIASFFIDKESSNSKTILYEYLAISLVFFGILSIATYLALSKKSDIKKNFDSL